jgi:hypothetical protein
MRVLSLFDGKYEVTEEGSVFSNVGNKKELIGKITNGGYRMIILTVNKKKLYKLVHRIVAEAFIENPLNKPEVNHINGDKTDNRVENLEWVTAQENQLHATKTGLQLYKIDMQKACEIRDLYKSGRYTQRVLAEMYGLKKTQIGYILNNKRWKV